MEQKVEEYYDEVFRILESFHYPEMVMEYEEADVAASMGKTIKRFIRIGQSPRMCAIVIWSLTMHTQIIPDAQARIVN